MTGIPHVLTPYCHQNEQIDDFFLQNLLGKEDIYNACSTLPQTPSLHFVHIFYEKGKHNWVVGFITIESYLQKAFLSSARSANVWNAATFVNIPSGCYKTLKIVLNLYTVSHSLRARKCVRVWDCIAFIFL